MAEIWGAVAAAVVGVAGSAVVANNSKPKAPGQIDLAGSLNNIGAQYPNVLQNYLSGNSAYNQNSLGGINNLVNGTSQFDPNAFFAAHPEAQGDWDAHFTNGENAGWTIEQFAQAFDPNALTKYTTQTQPGLLQTEAELNTATRTNNLLDAANLGGAYVGLTRAANQPYYNALDQYTQSTFQPVQQSASQQQAAQNASQGFGQFNPNGLYAQASQVNAPTGYLNVNAPTGYLNVNAPQGSPLLGQLNQQAMNQGPSAIQQQQNQIAQGLLAQGGQLSPSELRNVQQASRGGFAARGLDATNASVVDEAMQTDAAQRARLTQNLGLAQGVQNQGLAEQNQQQQFGLGVSNQNYGYGQLGVQAQTANQNAYQNVNQLNLAGQIANQGAYQNVNQLNLAGQTANQNAGLQAQLANQQFGLGSFNANLSSQTAQQQALMQSAQLQEQQRQAQLAQQSNAVALQRQGYLDPFAAITGSADTQLLGQILGTNQANQATQGNLYGALLNYGQDVNNTNYNANAAANIAGYNGQQALYGSLISAGSNLAGAYISNYNKPTTNTPTTGSNLSSGGLF